MSTWMSGTNFHFKLFLSLPLQGFKLPNFCQLQTHFSNKFNFSSSEKAVIDNCTSFPSTFSISKQKAHNNFYDRYNNNHKIPPLFYWMNIKMPFNMWKTIRRESFLVSRNWTIKIGERNNAMDWKLFKWMGRFLIDQVFYWKVFVLNLYGIFQVKWRGRRVFPIGIVGKFNFPEVF